MARFGWAALCVTVFAIIMFLVVSTAPDKRDPFSLSTVKVLSGGGHGSGVQVVAGGFILTAAHVLNGDPVVVTSNGKEAPAEVLWVSKEYDIALLRAPGLDAGVSPLNCSQAQVGLKIKAIGNPGPFDFVHSWGHISNSTLTVRGRWKSTITVDVTAGPGSSGGPVFDMRGGVVGIVVAYAPQIPGFMIVVPSSSVCDLVLRRPSNNA
jgi:S1-C subfamily serine protease